VGSWGGRLGLSQAAMLTSCGSELNTAGCVISEFAELAYDIEPEEIVTTLHTLVQRKKSYHDIWTCKGMCDWLACLGASIALDCCHLRWRLYRDKHLQHG
jgi:hypothetical protein